MRIRLNEKVRHQTGHEISAIWISDWEPIRMGFLCRMRARTEKLLHAPNTGTLDLGITDNHTLSYPTSLRDVGHTGFRYGPPAKLLISGHSGTWVHWGPISGLGVTHNSGK